MHTDAERLVVFFDEHRRCGGLETCTEAERVWVTCDGCGGAIAVPLHPPSLSPREESR